MTINKHMDHSERSIIENSLNNRLSFKTIGKTISKDCTTISKEVRNNFCTRNSTSPGRTFNNCIHRSDCQLSGVCDSCTSHFKYCKSCSKCRIDCNQFVEDICPKLSKPPYVCNGCKELSKCRITKHFYYASKATEKYESRLSESRKGININDNDIQRLNNLLVPLIKDQGQSIHHVFINHQDEIMMSEKTLYKIINAGLLKVRNGDLPRKVRMSPRKSKSIPYKVDKACLENRRYEDYLQFIEAHPQLAEVEMDTVEGVKGGSCILTLHFKNCSFMIGVKREANDSKSVTDYFDDLYKKIGRDLFLKLFPVILTDNGSEFSNPNAIEFDDEGQRRTYLFYCHPSSPHEKGSCEVNHELIRRVHPKGLSWSPYKQKDINLMMSHINSYARNKLNDKHPYLLMSTLYGKEVPHLLSISGINPGDINLTPSLISSH